MYSNDAVTTSSINENIDLIFSCDFLSFEIYFPSCAIKIVGTASCAFPLPNFLACVLDSLLQDNALVAKAKYPSIMYPSSFTLSLSTIKNVFASFLFENSIDFSLRRCSISGSSVQTYPVLAVISLISWVILLV